MKVRTRFAPSPTGYLHVGGIRTALFAWLVARQAEGEFILRLEDTDKAREVSGADQHIMDSLKALGLDWDEGPFKQSDRLDTYKKWARVLVEKGRAYADPRTPDELNSLREDARSKKQPFLARNYRPDNSPSWDERTALRFRSEPKAYRWQDAVMGELKTGPEVVDDFILMKSDGYPTYNFAHIIDDHEMKVSHVIRGQEFLASVPNYLNLYEALGFHQPILATMPHILNEQGNKKLSKRDGAKDVLDYIRQGFLSDALVNFIASLGWNDGTEQEIFSREELIQKFSLDHVQRSGARFDEHRLLWMNGHYIRELSLDKLYELAKNYWPESAASASDEYKKQVLALVQERLKFLAELAELTSFFFEEPAKMTIDDPEMLRSAIEDIEQSDFSLEDLSKRLNDLLDRLQTTPAILFKMLSVAVSGSNQYPPLAEMLHVLGKEKSLARLKKASQ